MTCGVTGTQPRLLQKLNYCGIFVSTVKMVGETSGDRGLWEEKRSRSEERQNARYAGAKVTVTSHEAEFR